MVIVDGARELWDRIQQDATEWRQFAGAWCRIVDGHIVEAVQYMHEGGEATGPTHADFWQAAEA